MKYLKKFQTNAQYQSYITDKTAHKPNVSYVTDDGEVFYNPKPHDYSSDYLTFDVKSPGTITIKGDKGYEMSFKAIRTIYYSVDGGSTWSSLTTSDTVKSFGDFAIGDKVLFKGENNSYWGDYTYNRFGGTAQVDVYGNIMSLVSGDNFEDSTTLTDTNNFSHLFKGVKVLSAKNLVLPATTLTYSCYEYMFNGCTSLVTAPELPATTLAENCYVSMFNGCTSLVTAPELPATTITGHCYQNMFLGCASLTSAPELPALTLQTYCYYYMFSGCTSLTTAPELPALTLQTYCYEGMFNGCTILNYVKMLATDVSANSCTTNWLNNVSATGTFVKNANATWTGRIPSGWTVVTATE